MALTLAPLEARLVACLIEKEITTPEQYPLSLNALNNACNQKSNRDPVMELDEAMVQQTLDGLCRKHLVSNQTGYGGRVTKYQHRFCNTEFSKLQFSARELAILCELLLRGPQTPGELRARASRLCPLNDVSEVEASLHQLSVRDDGPFVVRLAREPGKRESRYAHLLGGDIAATDDAPDAPSVSASQFVPEMQHTEALEQRVAALEAEVAQLKAFVASFQ